MLPKLAKAQLHFWEEPYISGINGSGTVFFSGCSLSCVYCQNYELSHSGKGKIISYKELSEIFRELENKGAHNINLVTPTHYADAVIKALEIYKPNIPIVYNSSGYEDIKVLRALEDKIDIYLMDFKYMSPDRAMLYSNAYDYPEVAKKAILEAYRQKSDCIIKNGIMQKGVIIRHLLMPQATKEAMSIFDWVREHTPNAYFSIMSQYIPMGYAKEMPIINRKITKREYEKVLAYINTFDFQNVFIQELTSANEAFIPDF